MTTRRTVTTRRTMTTRRIHASAPDSRKQIRSLLHVAVVGAGLGVMACLGGCATSLQARVPDIFSYEDVPTGELPSMFDGDVDPTAGLPVEGLPGAGSTPLDEVPTGAGGVPDPTGSIADGSIADGSIADGSFADGSPGDGSTDGSTAVGDPSGSALADDGPAQPAEPPSGLTLEELRERLGARPARDVPAAPRESVRPGESVRPARSGRVAGGLPPMPPPPTWDPSRDRTVRIGPDGKPLSGRSSPGTGSDAATGARGPRDIPDSRGPTASAETPAETPADAPIDTPAERAPRPSATSPRPELAGPSTSEIGAPPGGALSSPLAEGDAGTDPVAPDPVTVTPDPMTPEQATPDPLPARPAGSPFLSDAPGNSAPAASAGDKPQKVTPGEDMLPPTGALPPVIPGEAGTPTEPEPADPMPADTVPADAVPADAVPAEPVPAEPVPAEPAPADPMPADPMPADPVPAEPVPTEPGSATPSDPWVPGSGPPAGTAAKEPEPAPPALADDPWATGEGESAPPAGSGEQAPAGDTPEGKTPTVSDDPWSTAPGAAGDAPAATKPSKTAGAADPWESAGEAGLQPPTGPSGTTPGAPSAVPGEYVGKTPEKRALEHTTRLMDEPGSPSVPGYPSVILPSQPPGQALTPGIKPAVVVFYDDSSRASDLQAARILSLLVRYRAEIDFVGVDTGPDAPRTGGGDELAGRFLDQIPTVVVLDSERKTRLYKTGPFSADELERALDLCLTGTPLPGGVEPGPQAPETRAPDPKDPFAVPPEDPSANTPEARSGMSFTPPKNYSAKQHVARLKSAPGDVTVPAYPAELLPSAPAERALTSGLKPVVILFYDDASKPSDLQAADFLPVLVRRQSEVELVIIDVSARARWNEAQKRVVRMYYNFYVPTTVVLAPPNLAPVKSWYARTEADALERAIDQAKQR